MGHCFYLQGQVNIFVPFEKGLQQRELIYHINTQGAIKLRIYFKVEVNEQEQKNKGATSSLQNLNAL